MLKSSKKNNTASELEKFLWYSYFSVPYFVPESDEDKNKLIKICADRAYLDLSRRLVFTDNYKGDTKNKKELRQEFRSNICETILKQVKILLESSATDFDRKHDEACDAIIKEANNKGILKPCDGFDKAFTYGHAQKWLNMTLKYMRLTGFWDDEFERLKDVMHIPMDSYILKAASAKSSENKYGMDAEIAPAYHDTYYCKNTKSLTEYHEDGANKSQPWSKWHDGDYKKFLVAIRDALKKKPLASSLVEWEALAWIEQAENVK